MRFFSFRQGFVLISNDWVTVSPLLLTKTILTVVKYMTIVLFNTTYICLSFSHEPVSSRVLVGYFLAHKMKI